MSLLTIPNSFTNGTGPANIIDATQMNANFTAVATAVNNIYPSQVLPITSGQATFGATATGVGYKFLANDATAVPLTISGVTSQSVDLFDVTLTSGGTKAFFIEANGAARFGSNSTVAGLNAGDAEFSRGLSSGKILIGGSTAAGFLDYGVTVAGQFTLETSTNTGQLNLGAGGAYNQGTLWLPTGIAGNFSGLTTGNGGSQTVSTVVGTALCLVNSSVAAYIAVDVSGNMGIAGALHKGSGTFTIDHPLPQLADSTYLVHSFIEGPSVDLLYRGTVTLVNGTATVNLDAASKMTEGTFVLLNRNAQCFTTNETDWTPIKGEIMGNLLTISAQDTASTATISWMVIGQRQDKHIMGTDWTDENGYCIVEKPKAFAA